MKQQSSSGVRRRVRRVCLFAAGVGSVSLLWILLGALVAFNAFAQGESETMSVIDQTDPHAVHDLFRNPPNAYRMLQIVHGFNSHQPTDRLGQFLCQFGYGGVVANVAFSDHYLESEEDWAVFLKGLEDMRAAGLDFWLYDEKGYPSGKAGGITLRDHPEFEALGVLCARTDGTGVLRHVMPSGERVVQPPLSIVAVPVQNGVLDLSRRVSLLDQFQSGQSELTWQAPECQWAVLSFHVNRMYEGTHCICNYSDTLPYINIIDREAVGRFLDVTHEAYRDRCGADVLNDYVEAVFTDEPSLMTPYLKETPGLFAAVPWSRDFREAFRAEYGYDIVDALPHLYYEVGPDTPYRRLDYWRLVSKLVEDNFYGQIQDWCHDNGIFSSGHTIVEEQLYYHAALQGDTYRALRRMDIPGIDLLSSYPHELARAQQIPIAKLVASVTHMLGAVWNMSETSSHIQREQKKPVSFAQRLGTINWQYVQGLTRITSYYGFNEFTDDERRTFNDHIGRLGVLLTQGRHVADIAVYYPIQSMWAAMMGTEQTLWQPPRSDRAQRVNRAFTEVSVELLANQRDYDHLDDEAIVKAAAGAGALRVAGEEFRCFVLPETWVIPAATYEQIASFVSSGGALVAVGQLPEMGMAPQETERVKVLSEELSTSDRVRIVATSGEVPAALDALLPPDVRLDEPCNELWYCHRASDGRQIYFLSNHRDEPLSRTVTLRATGQPSLWHPATGKVTPLEAESDGQSTTLPVKLEAYEGVFIVLE